MKYYSVPLKLVPGKPKKKIMGTDYYSPDVPVGLEYLEHRHFDISALTCKVKVEDNVTVAGGALITEEEWGTL